MSGKAWWTRESLEGRLDRKHALRPAIAPERGIRHGVGLARQAAEADVGKKVAIVGVAQRARQHGRRMVGHVAAVGGEREAEREDIAVVVAADFVTNQKRMALSGCHPV